jgi:hypothetical protein
MFPSFTPQAVPISLMEVKGLDGKAACLRPMLHEPENQTVSYPSVRLGFGLRASFVTGQHNAWNLLQRNLSESYKTFVIFKHDAFIQQGTLCVWFVSQSCCDLLSFYQMLASVTQHSVELGAGSFVRSRIIKSNLLVVHVTV